MSVNMEDIQPLSDNTAAVQPAIGEIVNSLVEYARPATAGGAQTTP